ncbi:lysophospholipid acyltransferase family protein [Robertkochia solimangrovi]|uniref:lysophospholipid acyltransferase family protein n=1 Tax=Robertkochia solimangrovi TaxID=2213046 RepID=UPI00117F89BF|nr:lysophospholipid acyltransferase family protein [Robertkochia solimangrovi]TRZ45988.1 1-acyl-sn-glycerol-3-phosphate acyltransferase [Robertkochia solimangrovi]
MIIFKAIGYTLYRIWFYLLVAIPIVILFPFLLILSSSEKFYPAFFWVARNIWANIILFGMGCWVSIKREQKPVKGKSYMLVANHTSMTDIMLMLRASSNPFVFVGKKELVKIPVFGFFYKRVCIMVDRNSTKSRSAVYKRAQRRLNQGLSICIFPEGGVPDDENVILDEFKDGAFRLAIEHQIPVVPMTFIDNKKRFPFKFLAGGPGKMRAVIHPFQETKGLSGVDKEILKTSCRQVIFQELQKYS